MVSLYRSVSSKEKMPSGSSARSTLGAMLGACDGWRVKDCACLEVLVRCEGCRGEEVVGSKRWGSSESSNKACAMTMKTSSRRK
jgi:hypothetical protein